MQRIRSSLLIVAAALALGLGTGGNAGARSKTARVCKGAALRGSTGPEHGSVHRGDRVIVTRRDKRHARAYVIARNGQGWIPSSSLCRRR